MAYEVKPLYRKVNTRARGVHHNSGGDAKYDRHTKDGMNKSMSKDVQRGLDYTPLYRFLLSKVGEDWNEIHSEAVKRLDHEEPIYHLVSLPGHAPRQFVMCGESSYYSGLFVDDNSILRFVNPFLCNEDFTPDCSCCTFTFNGTPSRRRHTSA